MPDVYNDFGSKLLMSVPLPIDREAEGDRMYISTLQRKPIDRSIRRSRSQFHTQLKAKRSLSNPCKADSHKEIIRAAEFSKCSKYRYTLSRIWDPLAPTIMIVGLNPSTADANKDDPTVRRCIGFASTWGFGGLILTNLFAFRATNPKELLAVEDPVGPGNDDYLRDAVRKTNATLVAWGAHGGLLERDVSVLALLSSPRCLGVTKSGFPKHPLYIAARKRSVIYKKLS